jgi:hypothetical protein
MAMKPLLGFSGRRFGLEPVRLVLVFMGVAAVYGFGIVSAGFAASRTVRDMRAGVADIHVGWWLLAFGLVVCGILSIVYAVFFRPRELRVSEDEVRIVGWDGKGPAIARKQLESIHAGSRRVVLLGGGKRLVIGRMFAPWDEVRGELVAWAGAEKRVA